MGASIGAPSNSLEVCILPWSCWQYGNLERNRICEHMTITQLRHSMFTQKKEKKSVEKGQTLFQAGARESLGTRLLFRQLVNYYRYTAYIISSSLFRQASKGHHSWIVVVFYGCRNFDGDEYISNFTIKGNVAVYKGLFLELPSSHVVIITAYTFPSVY